VDVCHGNVHARNEEPEKFHFRLCCSPNRPQVVSIQVPGLELALGVLEHDLNELVQVEPHHRRPRPGSAAVGPRRDAVPGDNMGDVEAVRELQRRVRRDKRDAVHRAPHSKYHTCWVVPGGLMGPYVTVQVKYRPAPPRRRAPRPRRWAPAAADGWISSTRSRTKLAVKRSVVKASKEGNAPLYSWIEWKKKRSSRCFSRVQLTTAKPTGMQVGC
jgi:hypothetical protein